MMLWQSEQDEKLKSLWASGLNAREVALEFGGGVSRNAVIGRIHRLGLEKRLPTQSAELIAHRRRERLERKNALNREAWRDYGAERAAKARRQQGWASAAPVVAPARAPDARGIALLDLEVGDCRYPHGEGADMRFCGAPKKWGSSYCPHCHGIVYTAVSIGQRRPFVQPRWTT